MCTYQNQRTNFSHFYHYSWTICPITQTHDMIWNHGSKCFNCVKCCMVLFLNLSLLTGNTTTVVGRNNHINWLLDLFNAISVLSMVLIQIMLRVSASTKQCHLRLRAILRSRGKDYYHFSLNSSRGSHTSYFLKKIEASLLRPF
jgi:hypothetical protein